MRSLTVSIFTTLSTTEEINELFQWVERNPHLQFKANKFRITMKILQRPKKLYHGDGCFCFAGKLLVL